MRPLTISLPSPVKTNTTLKDERGFVLILAMAMLLIMSILGTMALNTATTETGISGNYRTAQIAFDSAQRAVEYASTNGNIYLNLGPGSAPYDLDNTTDQTLIAAGSNWGLSGTENFVEFQMAGGLPPGSGSDPTYFEARYYIVNASGEGPANSVAHLEAQIGRIVPK
jgi:hypothetical protein